MARTYGADLDKGEREWVKGGLKAWAQGRREGVG
jgi:hypothetical protein